jgi:enoyl-CoA hydratase/carnithine racemase
VNQIMPHAENLLLQVISFAEPILNGAPLAIRAALKAIRGATTRELAAGLALERSAYEACLTSEDRLEALAAFTEKRRPVFKGK